MFLTALVGLALYSSSLPLVYGLDDGSGVGRLPALAYNTWNAYQCNIDEDLIVTTAQLMVSLGLQDVGYNRVNLDDCWAMKNRTADGSLQPDTTRFSKGFNWLTDQLHSMGFQAGIYSDSGWLTCAGYPGSYQNEARDAETFQDWGFDYLKYDNCYIPFDDVLREGVYGKYQRMSGALVNLSKSTGQPPLLFSLCEWGWDQVWLWGASVGHSWRTTGDISPSWDSLASIINTNSFITQATNFYGRNDMDMLQLGNGNMTFDEAKSHFTAWALMKSPLIIGTNLSAITNETLEILTNKEILAINQDPVYGTSISPFRWGVNPDWVSNASYPAQYWSGQSQNGTVFMLLNTLDEPADMTFNLTESAWIRAGIQYNVRDLWTHTDNGTAIRSFTATAVPPHGVVALLLTEAGDEPAGLWPPCAGAADSQCSTPNGTHVE
ncbi:glycoside hydrolase [Gloeophyllum trabeum ATCC 11539]|uniref:Alpha-galactosidase n=1 Tax=Gloeophyllum trabeum (strain ATCC 11539 / FP-39264 / Madison 617) TaxID=670483 RepID=S7PXM0_GLOTA|nr:glycoside hydrolase [Gloeophyllum trabeum ATCC 11539]EPQ52042.1 glycoside hydrolase [Gloeophyllum trabeum ATCC 11539]